MGARSDTGVEVEKGLDEVESHTVRASHQWGPAGSDTSNVRQAYSEDSFAVHRAVNPRTSTIWTQAQVKSERVTLEPGQSFLPLLQGQGGATTFLRYLSPCIWRHNDSEILDRKGHNDCPEKSTVMYLYSGRTGREISVSRRVYSSSSHCLIVDSNLPDEKVKRRPKLW